MAPQKIDRSRLRPERMRVEWRRDFPPEDQLEGDPTGWFSRVVKESEEPRRQEAELFLMNNPDRYYYSPGFQGRVRYCYDEV